MIYIYRLIKLRTWRGNVAIVRVKPMNIQQPEVRYALHIKPHLFDMPFILHGRLVQYLSTNRRRPRHGIFHLFRRNPLWWKLLIENLDDGHSINECERVSPNLHRYNGINEYLKYLNIFMNFIEKLLCFILKSIKTYFIVVTLTVLTW